MREKLIRHCPPLSPWTRVKGLSAADCFSCSSFICWCGYLDDETFFHIPVITFRITSVDYHFASYYGNDEQHHRNHRTQVLVCLDIKVLYSH